MSAAQSWRAAACLKVCNWLHDVASCLLKVEQYQRCQYLRVDRLDPLHVVGHLDGNDVEIDDHGFLTQSHKDALEHLVTAGIDLLVDDVGRHIDAIAGTGFSHVCEVLAHARTPPFAVPRFHGAGPPPSNAGRDRPPAHRQNPIEGHLELTIRRLGERLHKIDPPGS